MTIDKMLNLFIGFINLYLTTALNVSIDPLKTLDRGPRRFQSDIVRRKNYYCFC